MSLESGSKQSMTMTWQERQEAVSRVMQCLDTVDTKDDDRSDVLLDVLAAAAELVLPPGFRVDLLLHVSRYI